MGKDPGLAAAGPGQHQIAARRRRHGVALGLVQRVQNVGDIHRVFDLFNGNGFGQIPGLIHVCSFEYGHMIRQKLHGDHVNYR